MEEVIAAAHKYMDYINIQLTPEYEEATMELLTNELGVPAHKLGWMMTRSENMEEEMMFLVNSIKQRGLRGLSFFSANEYKGEFLKKRVWLNKSIRFAYAFCFNWHIHSFI